MDTQNDFISQYLEYTKGSESPVTFNRWSCISLLSAWLGRRYFFPFGYSNINCNTYVMLMGSAGTRKSTAIKLASKLIRQAGYTNIAADKSTKEKFLLDLAGDDPTEEEDILTQNIFGDSLDEDKEIFVAADEFNIFVGNGNVEFLSLLGTLWDMDGVFESRTKNSKAAKINNPTVTILAGNTPTGFTLAFPPEAVGQGIMSRLILVHGNKTNKRITFPKPPDPEDTKKLITSLQTMRTTSFGAATLTPKAESLLDAIYQSYEGVNDIRFESYNNRRFTHLLKLCLLVSAAFYKNKISESATIYANTILAFAESSMPTALGEFGKARNSDVSHKVMGILENSVRPVVTFAEIWSQVYSDLANPDELKAMLSGLIMANKAMSVKGGFIGKRSNYNSSSDYVDFSLLTKEERDGIGL